MPSVMGVVIDSEFILLYVMPAVVFATMAFLHSRAGQDQDFEPNPQNLDRWEAAYGSVNNPDVNGETLFFKAAASGNMDMLKALHEHGANIKSRNDIRQTSLHVAKTPEVAKYLLDLGLRHDDRQRSGATPLLDASRYNNEEVVLLLMDRGANARARDSKGNTLVHLCASERFLNIALKEGMSVNSLNDEGQTALHVASRFCLSTKALSLIVHGADADIQDKCGQTCLHIVTCPDVAKTLLASGVHSNLVDNKGKTANDVQIQAGRQDIAKMISEKVTGHAS
eukprot:TRINITY_DN21431_c0_g1_i1.p1 TRINITY_DN21431_c0_g1~~TRINITY_DN21431_c0_g1_i1.p1  ORF type:complete len:282 (-),score=37.15 TRINITY_DN21431_c0_g1_i1:13-858(-)